MSLTIEYRETRTLRLAVLGKEAKGGRWAITTSEYRAALPGLDLRVSKQDPDTYILKCCFISNMAWLEKSTGTFLFLQIYKVWSGI